MPNLEAVRKNLKSFTSGGNKNRLQLKSITENVLYVGGLALLASLVTFATVAFALTGGRWVLYWRYNVARVMDFVPGLGDSAMWGFQLEHELLPAHDYVLQFGAAYHQNFLLITPLAFVAGAAAFGLVFFKLYRRNVLTGENIKDEVIRGAGEVITAAETNKITSEFNKKINAELVAAGMVERPIINFATVNMPIGFAQRNFLLTGSQGTGKTVVLKHLMSQAAERKKLMVVFDPVCEFAEFYFRAGTEDVIFNPFDSRFPGWNIFSEIKKRYDYDAIAAYLIPFNEEKSGSAGKFFVTAARVVFAEGLRKLRKVAQAEGRQATTEDAVKLFFETSHEDLAKFLEGTAGHRYANPEAKSSGDVLATLIASIYVLQYVKSGDFSLREFISKGGDRRIFITSKEEVHDALQAFTAMAVQVLYKAVMNGDKVHEDMSWFFLEELHSMGMLPALEGALTKSRKFGAVTVLALQTKSQLVQLYGESGSKIILDNAQNFLILRVSDPDTQDDYSKKLGSTEYLEISEGTSHGTEDSRDSETENQARKERRVVMPSEIKMLADLTGYLQLAGPYAVTFVEFRSLINYNLKPISQGWAPRDDLDIEHELVAYKELASAQSWDESALLDDFADSEASESSLIEAMSYFQSAGRIDGAEPVSPAEATESSEDSTGDAHAAPRRRPRVH